jgi:hypothetical protein
MHDCVLVGGVNGFKISDDARTLVAERIRARDGSNAAFRSTGPDETTSVEFGDVVVSGFGSYFRLNGPETYELQDGTSLIVTDCAADKEAQLYLTDSATLDASNAAVYSNRANSAAGFESDTGANGSVISEYYVYDNDDGPTGSLANVTIDQMEERDVTDIDGVPTADEVGAWSRSWRVPVPLWRPAWPFTTAGRPGRSPCQVPSRLTRRAMSCVSRPPSVPSTYGRNAGSNGYVATAVATNRRARS